MLVPVQTSGDKPPLFFVHGLREIMPLARAFATVLGPDQPFHALNASAADGREPPIEQMCESIRRVRPAGPLRIGGMREGTFAALGIARELLQQGRQIGPAILVNPPPLAGGEPTLAPFSSPAELILTPRGAASFFHPQLPWHKLLSGSRIVHVVPWDHEDLFRSGREDVARLLKFILEQVPTFEVFAESPTERTVA
jgi:pimeloyl-ACP methyl ester carboxylesterase